MAEFTSFFDGDNRTSFHRWPDRYKITVKLIWKAHNQSCKILLIKRLQRSFKNYLFASPLSPETYLDRLAAVTLSQDHYFRSKSLI